MTGITPLGICVDAYPPGGCFDPRERPDPVDLRSTSHQELALKKYKLWQEGQTLHVRFMDGAELTDLRQAIEGYAREWLRHANLKFRFGNFAESEIRITFYGSDHWSKVGTEAMDVPRDMPTMCLRGFIRGFDPVELRRVVLHEFGHAIGCVHEQARPNAAIPWNPPQVYAYYLEHYRWNQAMVDKNIFERYAPTDLEGSASYDRNSIMQYPVPKELTTGGFSVDWNSDLSETDQKFIASMYPK